ncbi:MAG: hypothetical protein ABSE95_09570 [Thermodesulfobacteriota bacterium]|jgi:hypothetical protein
MDITVSGSPVAPEKIAKKKPFPSYFLLGGGLVLFLFYLAIWPMVWHLILLPHARPDKHQLRVESYAPHRVDNTFLFLDRPDTSLTAYAVWQVPKEGFYHFKLSCDDNGKVLIDNRPIISLIGISPNNVGEAKQWLTPGPHFLKLRLNNILDQGWLRIEVAEPGQAGYSSLSTDELSYLELGNIETWLGVVFWGKIFCLLGFLGFSLLWVRFYFHRQPKMFSPKQDTAKTRAPEKPIPSYFLLWAGLFFFLFHFAVWPLVSHWILLPHVRPHKHQLRVESYSPNRVIKTSLFLDKPDTSLTAYAMWQVPKKGLYHLKLSCSDNGKVLIDNRPIITLRSIRPWNVGETKQWLTPGPHFLELNLNNELGQGWLRIEVAGPGQADYSSLSTDELSYLELGNIKTWLEVVSWGEYLCFLGFLGLILLWVGLLYFRRRQGNLFPNRSWKYFFLALAIFTLITGMVFHTIHLPPIWGDGLGYYSYLPSYLIYHDLSMESLFSPTRLYFYPSTSTGSDLHDGEGFIRYPATGRYLIKYPVGTAVLMFPFFLLGHLLAPLVGSTPDGFSMVYQFAIEIAAVFYMLVGLILIFKILIRYFPSKVVAATILSLFLGTNLLAYAAVELSLSHIYSFFLIGLLLYLVPRWYADPSIINTFFLGIVSGLIPLVRNPNVVFLVFLPLYGITNWESLKERALFLWQKKYKLFLWLTVAFGVFSPQFIIWKIATNQFLVSTYTFPFERFYFFSPQILKVLFNLHHGLFLWSPILLFSVFGFWNMKGPLKPYRLPIVVCLLLHIYVVSSWYLWYFAWSFGHRAFVDDLGMFALPLACFFGGLQKTIVKRSVIIVSTFFIAFTFYLFIQYFHGVLPGEIRPHTWPVYEKILLDQSGMIDFWKWLKNPQMTNYRLSR